MKHTFKKLFSMFMTAVMVISMMPVSAFAETEPQQTETAVIAENRAAQPEYDVQTYVPEEEKAPEIEAMIRCLHEDVTHVPAGAQTCVEDGNLEYWVCELCGEYALDVNFLNSGASMEEMGIIIPADGTSHTLTEVPVPDQDDYVHYYDCTNEGCNYHTEPEECYEGEVEDLICEACGGTLYFDFTTPDNKKLIDVHVKIVDQNGDPVVGAEVDFIPMGDNAKSIKDGNGGMGVSDENGEIVLLDMPDGITGILYQSYAPEGYTESADEYTISNDGGRLMVRKNDGEFKEYINNKKIVFVSENYQTIDVYAKVEDQFGDPVAGADFEVFAKFNGSNNDKAIANMSVSDKLAEIIGDYSYVMTLTSDENGMVIIEDVPDTDIEILLVQILSPEGYTLEEDFYKVMVSGGKAKATKNAEGKAKTVNKDNPIIFKNEKQVSLLTIPVTINVNQTGNKAPGKQTMTFRAFRQYLAPTAVEKGDELKLSINSVTTKGKGATEGQLELVIDPAKMHLYENGFIIGMDTKAKSDWEFAKELYLVYINYNYQSTDDMAGVTLEAYAVDPETGDVNWDEPTDLVFNCTYSGNKSAQKEEKPAPPHVPNTSDTTGTGLYAGMVLFSAAALIVLAEYKKRKI